MIDRLRSTTRTLGVITLLICALSLAGLGTSRARAPLSSPSVHRYAQPCNLLCRAYLAWSSRVTAARNATRQLKTTAAHHRSPRQRVAHHRLRMRQRGLDSFAQLHLPNDAAPRIAELPPSATAPSAPEAQQPAETAQAAEPPRAAEPAPAAAPTQVAEATAAEVAPSRPIDQIADRFPAVREFMMARVAGADIVPRTAADRTVVARADTAPAIDETDMVDAAAPDPDTDWTVWLALALCTLPALILVWRARGRRARTHERLLTFDRAIAGAPPQPMPMNLAPDAGPGS